MDTAVSIVDNSTWNWKTQAPRFTCLLDYMLVTSRPGNKLILPFTTMASTGGNGC